MGTGGGSGDNADFQGDDSHSRSRLRDGTLGEIEGTHGETIVEIMADLLRHHYHQL